MTFSHDQHPSYPPAVVHHSFHNTNRNISPSPKFQPSKPTSELHVGSVVKAGSHILNSSMRVSFPFVIYFPSAVTMCYEVLPTFANCKCGLSSLIPSVPRSQPSNDVFRYPSHSPFHSLNSLTHSLFKNTYTELTHSLFKTHIQNSLTHFSKTHIQKIHARSFYMDLKCNAGLVWYLWY